MEDHAQADAELRVSGDDLTSNCGTVRFMAPEVAAVDGRERKRTTPRRTSSRWPWSTTSSGSAPYPASPSATSRLCIWRLSGKGRRPSYGRTPKPIRELVNHMWRLEAQDRPSAADVLDYARNVKHKPTFGGGVLKVTPPATGGLFAAVPPARRATDVQFPSLHKNLVCTRHPLLDSWGRRRVFPCQAHAASAMRRFATLSAIVLGPSRISVTGSSVRTTRSCR